MKIWTFVQIFLFEQYVFTQSHESPIGTIGINTPPVDICFKNKDVFTGKLYIAKIIFIIHTLRHIVEIQPQHSPSKSIAVAVLKSSILATPGQIKQVVSGLTTKGA